MARDGQGQRVRQSGNAQWEDRERVENAEMVSGSVDLACGGARESSPGSPSQRHLSLSRGIITLYGARRVCLPRQTAALSGRAIRSVYGAAACISESGHSETPNWTVYGGRRIAGIDRVCCKYCEPL